MDTYKIVKYFNQRLHSQFYFFEYMDTCTYRAILRTFYGYNTIVYIHMNVCQCTYKKRTVLRDIRRFNARKTDLIPVRKLL